MNKMNSSINFNKLWSFTSEQIFTDLVLIIKDDKEVITINLHKNILAASSPYFMEILNNAQTEKYLTIFVPNAKICYNIISDFYGQKINHYNYSPEEYFLEECKCKISLGLEIDLVKFYQQDFSSDMFEKVLEVIKLLGFNKKTIKIIMRNVPNDFDLKKIPKDILFLMYQFCNTYKFLYKKYRATKMLVFEPEFNILNKFNLKTHNPHKHQFSHDNKYLAISYDYGIKIYDTKTFNKIKRIKTFTDPVYYMTFSPDNKYFAYEEEDRLWSSNKCISYDIKIINLETKTTIACLKHQQYVENILFSNKSDYFITKYQDYPWKVNLWDIKTSQLIKQYNTQNYQTYFDSNDRLIMETEHYNELRYLESGELLYKAEKSMNKFMPFSDSEILYVDGNEIYKVNIFTKSKIIFRSKNKNIERICPNINNNILVVIGDNYVEVFDLTTTILLENFKTVKNTFNLGVIIEKDENLAERIAQLIDV
ncbi:BTB and WD40 domain containing protein [Saudi moumouvirus]|uniref:Putative BTB_POZ domain-containing protein n=1 Tax=Moumouvirus sp. 'Monve' TaxID=1128131 RepID=H2ED62_9VIRU|nr:putative BTB_POZ domain-containing protein [Moumouvirus Monve]AQN68651.1 BTB and WD40 domain containing protein [Saudi moumouvirus]